MSAFEPDDELAGLLSEFLDGELDADGQRRLNERLLDDPEAQQAYLDMCELHGALTWEHGMVIGELPPQPSVRRGPSLLKIAGACVLAASLLVAVWIGTADKAPHLGDQSLATITSRIDAELTKDQQAWLQSEVSAGAYQLERGLLEIYFASGVTVILEAPSRLEFLSDEHLVLHSGRISANVPPAGKGFTIDTPDAHVVDFGTEFSLDVSDVESEVHVFGGLVRVQPRSADGKDLSSPVDLRTDQAVRVTRTEETTASIDIATDRFIRSIVEPRWVYPKLVKRWKPVAYYRMAIREKGLACTSPGDPAELLPEKAGEILKGTGQQPPWAPGRIGSSLKIGGQSLGRGGVIRKRLLTENVFSIAGWVRPVGLPSGAVIASDLNGESSGRFIMRLDPVDGKLQAAVRLDDGTLAEVQATEPLALSQWHHVVMTYNGKSLRLFQNGNRVGSRNVEQLANASDVCWIGTDDSRTQLWHGRIDELAFFNRALTEAQVDVLFKSVEDLPVPAP